MLELPEEKQKALPLRIYTSVLGIIHTGNLSKCRQPAERAPETLVSMRASSRLDVSELTGWPQRSWLRVQTQSLATRSRGRQ